MIRVDGVSLANSPSVSNEVLELLDDKTNVVEQVNYDDTLPWPSGTPDGASIYLPPEAFAMEAGTANDVGSNWARSDTGVDAVRANVLTSIFNGMEMGSPAEAVVRTVPEPRMLLLFVTLVLLGALLATRRRQTH